MTKRDLSILIKRKSKELGFDECGFARAEKLDEEARYLESWLNQEKHGKNELRSDVTMVVNKVSCQFDNCNLVSNI